MLIWIKFLVEEGKRAHHKDTKGTKQNLRWSPLLTHHQGVWGQIGCCLRAGITPLRAFLTWCP